jgi:hypothetical protein
MPQGRMQRNCASSIGGKLNASHDSWSVGDFSGFTGSLDLVGFSDGPRVSKIKKPGSGLARRNQAESVKQYVLS